MYGIKRSVLDVVNLQNMRAHVDPPSPQYLHGYGSGKDQGGRQSTRKMPAASIVVIPVITYFASIVGMPRSHKVA